MSYELKVIPDHPARSQLAKEQLCPLCQHKFPLEGATCSGCGMRGGCEMVKCPRCGYKFVEESKILTFLKGLFKR